MQGKAKILFVALVILAVITLVYIFVGFGFITLVIALFRDCLTC